MCFSLQTVEHGFPHQPSALGYSPSLRILAIGTRSGAVKLYPLRLRGQGDDLWDIGEILRGPVLPCFLLSAWSKSRERT